MIKNVFRKGLVIGIIILFIGASVTACDCNKTTVNISEEQEWTNTPGENLAEKYSIDQLCGLVEPDDWWVDAEFDPCMPTSTLPDSFDWRDEAGGLPPIRNQGGCGACWAFGTIAPLECNIKIKDGYVVDLSEQWLISCNRDGYSCSGGWWCHEYFKVDGTKTDPCGDSGAVWERYFPYTSSNAPCNCPYPHDYFIDNWAYVGSPSGVASTSAIKQAIYDYGPVTAAVCVNSAFVGYSGGVFSGPYCSSINHCVSLVGWDDNQGTNGVWFLRNSWGSGWGEGGYMRIEYGVCRVGYATVRITYSGSPNDPPYEPSNPDPEDGETDVDVRAVLTWTCSDPDDEDPLIYDVYFGKSSSPKRVSKGQSASSYEPPTMKFETTYYWRIVAFDVHGASISGPVWHFTIRPREPPGAPTITGETNGKIGTEYEYTFNALHPDGDDVKYHIDWDDGNYEITDFNPSGTNVLVKHTWDEKGTYKIRCKAKDIYGLESDWATLTVTMPRNKAINSPFLNFLQHHPNLFPLLRLLLRM